MDYSNLEQGLEFDDVLIIPKVSNVSSREDVDISVSLANFKLQFPLIASPMRDIVDASFLKKMNEFGGMGILHRFYDNKDEWIKDIHSLRDYDYGAAIGLGSDDYTWILDENPRVLLVDVANGYLTSLHRYVEKVKYYIQKNNYHTLLMAGNVVEETGTIALSNAGTDIIRVSIGSGQNCSTRNATGVSVPTLTAIQKCASANTTSLLLADGGIRYSGDFVKVIVAGSDFGMAGKLFAETYESPAETTIRGMASRKHMETMNYKIKSVEGFDTKIDKKHSLEQFMSEFGFGIKSAGTYLNASNLDQIRSNGRFIRCGSGSIKNLA